MKKIKITVLTRKAEKAFTAQYGFPGLTIPCPFHTEGQVIYCEKHYRPTEICGEAWKVMDHFVYALYYGADQPLGQDWMREPGVAIVTCNDGLRPVTFKIECVDE